MTSHNYTSLALGRWAGADFQRTASQHRGVGADSDIPDEYRFVRGVLCVFSGGGGPKWNSPVSPMKATLPSLS